MDQNDCVQNYCRICASNCPDKRNLFDVIYDGKRLINILEHCLKRPLDTGIYFPNSICSDCFVGLIKTYEFFALFEKSEKWFASHFNASNTVQVKSERIETELAEGESANHLDIAVKEEDEICIDAIADVGIYTIQENVLEARNGIISESNDLTGDNDLQFELIPLESNEVDNYDECYETTNYDDVLIVLNPYQTEQQKEKQKREQQPEQEAWRFECYICKKSAFDGHIDLSLHMERHFIDKPFKCSYCDCAYSQRWAVNKHLRTHFGPLPYKCQSICGKSFRFPSELRKHSCHQFTANKN